VLQPRYPSLPFFAHAPFYGPDWNEYALTVRSSVAVGEPPSLLLQRALPEISSALESSRDAILQNSNRLANGIERRLEGRLCFIQENLGALLQGRVPLNLIGYFGQPEAAAATAAAASTAATAAATAAAAAAAELPAAPTEAGIPISTALAKAYTIQDVWKQWKEGYGSQPPIRELEKEWGSRWRPGNAIRVQFCRRKVIWDEIQARIARGQSEDEAIAELELLRASRSLKCLADELKKKKSRCRR
jgi:hypothetical protein